MILTSFWVILLFFIHHMFVVTAATPLSVTGTKAMKDAEYAIKELKKLSDSRIYETLSLSKIISAEEEDGIYHVNTLLTIELTSGHFKSGMPVESFHMVVMRNKIDDSMSFAINEFPEMDELSIEKSWIKKVKERRGQREAMFKKIEQSSIGDL